MRRLEGKTILVAGGGGIGGELAHRYAREGANVILGDCNGDSARAVASEIEQAGGTAIGVDLDGADEASIASAVERAVTTFGGLDGLHANFASFADNGNDVGVLELPLEALDETLRVNLRGFYLCTRAALPPILARGGGTILYTSSVAAYTGEPTRVAYAMAKAADHALMRHVAARYGPQGVRANAVAPGAIMHEKWEEALPQEMKDWLFGNAMIKSRLGRPQDIAAISAMLMSEEGSYITGQVFCVDGGVTMRS
ncbi:SDR family NAD(P)-dependent oxidoreductase [Novosphingobium album (ex Hu et al. 2023)]|uniref:SDR family oxidoreductase n=1 Tax=Novosphingobium album (ex Hu et al. 2023) TaxID=2930093 RepID=A0ABT0B5C2_9SPHN|nr:SDR family oxidoreductase [Novosphingobium album (ex Hu et al. 2023)]MCJ2180260.1 SDR family oxidoreductase [Novosphingobium album (ex Hu et al. 2023)]